MSLFIGKGDIYSNYRHKAAQSDIQNFVYIGLIFCMMIEYYTKTIVNDMGFLKFLYGQLDPFYLNLGSKTVQLCLWRFIRQTVFLFKILYNSRVYQSKKSLFMRKLTNLLHFFPKNKDIQKPALSKFLGKLVC